MKFKDYYETLGVSRGADAEAIKRAYRKQARRYHPDVSKERNAEEKFKDVQEAYEVLKDADKRAAYDQVGRDYRGGQQFRAPPDWEQRFKQSNSYRYSEVNGFSDFFSSLFGGAGAGAGDAGIQSQAETEAAQVEVAVEEAYAGTRRRVTVSDRGHARLIDVQIPAGVTEGQALRVGGWVVAAPSCCGSNCGLMRFSISRAGTCTSNCRWLPGRPPWGPRSPCPRWAGPSS